MGQIRRYVNSQCFFCAGCMYKRRHHKDKHPGNATHRITYSVYMTNKQGRWFSKEGKKENENTKYLMYKEVTLSCMADRLVVRARACVAPSHHV